ncbi:uncharacterized protein F5Z01DRAFT_197798 [Emericellopsis atlantica]|uniref:Uncharacterized protein n=1 Tax=Emericellopsis atlantica TaxID=2614577 RepID=A0A9P8CTQ1_9HYPO|nr:uncharacterized protein F5Z01DRAFT_197798 [Emericellopsis atlantica]KAG9258465.1 hypothetical protein F5Z01DRAFT_197798 [Emericellopsis atlantica]
MMPRTPNRSSRSGAKASIPRASKRKALPFNPTIPKSPSRGTSPMEIALSGLPQAPVARRTSDVESNTVDGCGHAASMMLLVSNDPNSRFGKEYQRIANNDSELATPHPKLSVSQPKRQYTRREAEESYTQISQIIETGVESTEEEVTQVLECLEPIATVVLPGEKKLDISRWLRHNIRQHGERLSVLNEEFDECDPRDLTVVDYPARDQTSVEAINNPVVFIAEQLNDSCRDEGKVQKAIHLTFLLADVQADSFQDLAHERDYWRAEAQSVRRQLAEKNRELLHAKSTVPTDIESPLDLALKLTESLTREQAENDKSRLSSRTRGPGDEVARTNHGTIFGSSEDGDNRATQYQQHEQAIQRPASIHDSDEGDEANDSDGLYEPSTSSGCMTRRGDDAHGKRRRALGAVRWSKRLRRSVR